MIDVRGGRIGVMGVSLDTGDESHAPLGNWDLDLVIVALRGWILYQWRIESHQKERIKQGRSKCSVSKLQKLSLPMCIVEGIHKTHSH